MRGAWSGGKGSTPRPVNNKGKKNSDETIDRVFGDYCRFFHDHTKDCKMPPKKKKEDK